MNALKRDGLVKKIIEFKQDIGVTALLVSEATHVIGKKKELSCKGGNRIRMSKHLVRNSPLRIKSTMCLWITGKNSGIDH